MRKWCRPICWRLTQRILQEQDRKHQWKRQEKGIMKISQEEQEKGRKEEDEQVLGGEVKVQIMTEQLMLL